MDPNDKLKLLKGLRLLDQIPEEKLSTLSGYLQPSALKDGAVVFEEGSKGDSLYFVSSGQVRISKKFRGEGGKESSKDLALLGPGDCFGEMALIDEAVPRSARASALGETVIFVLAKAELHKWLKAHPELAIGFFAELVQVLSKRLRRSSSELTLLFDLSQWLLEPVASGKELLQRVLGHLVPHLDGSWTGAAFLFNAFNAEMDPVATEGTFAVAAEAKTPAFGERKTLWADGHTLAVSLPGKKGLRGYLLLRAAAELPADEKSEVARTLATAAGLIASALENIDFRTEDAMRDRLKSSMQSYGRGL